MTRNKQLVSLKNVLSHRNWDNVRTAVPVFGDGLNIQAAHCSGKRNSDEWNQILFGIAKELKINKAAYNDLPLNSPFLWEALVMKLANANSLKLDRADLMLKKIVAKRLKILEQKKATRSFYKKIISCHFRNIISLSIDRRLELQGSSIFRSKSKGKNLDAFCRHAIVRFPDKSATNIWYPYGDTKSPGEIRMGMMWHADRLRNMEDRRGDIMNDWAIREYVGWMGDGNKTIDLWLQAPDAFYEERLKTLDTWYDLLFLAPLVIIGTSLSLEDWPIWWMLHQRARNFVPFDNAAVPKTFYLATQKR